MRGVFVIVDEDDRMQSLKKGKKREGTHSVGAQPLVSPLRACR